MPSILTKVPQIIKRASNKVLMFDGTLERGTRGGAFDPATGTWSGGAPVTYTFRGVVNNASGFYRRNSIERVGNVTVIALQPTFSPSTDPKTGDLVRIQGEVATVKKFHRDPADATWLMDCAS